MRDKKTAILPTRCHCGKPGKIFEGSIICKDCAASSIKGGLYSYSQIEELVQLFGVSITKADEIFLEKAEKQIDKAKFESPDKKMVDRFRNCVNIMAQSDILPREMIRDYLVPLSKDLGVFLKR